MEFDLSIQVQPEIDIGIPMPLASGDPPLSFGTGDPPASSVFIADVAISDIGVTAPLTQQEVDGPLYVLDLYLAYLTHECPPMPEFGGYGQIFPWTGVVPGTDGRDPTFRTFAGHIQWSLSGSGDWQNLVPLSEITGPTGAAAYIHAQPTASSTWVINHNLGRYPSVEVFNNLMQEIDAEVAHPSVNQTVVALNPATAGQAHLI